MRYQPQAVFHVKLTYRRLAYSNLEVRDAYFTRLKAKIELFKRTSGEKVVLCSHS